MQNDIRKKGRSGHPRKKGKKPVQALTPTREEPERPVPTRVEYEVRMSSWKMWNWMMDPGVNTKEYLPMAINLLWARDGKQWEDWERQHCSVSLPDIAAMVFNYLAADMGINLLLPPPQAVGTSTPGRREEPHPSQQPKESNTSPQRPRESHTSPQ
ncbi:UNVERIFIED_CONTAM: hypothetical protein FKN15_017385 [Acipenser sinensis]